MIAPLIIAMFLATPIIYVKRPPVKKDTSALVLREFDKFFEKVDKDGEAVTIKL